MNPELNRKMRTICAAIVATALSLCAGASVAAQAGSTGAAQGNDGRDKAAATATRVVTDETGRQVAVPQPVLRIVSLAPSVTETIFALSADERLVGDTDYCNYPLEAQKKTKVGGMLNPSIEEVVALRPDLVIVTKTTNRLQTVEALEHLHLAVYSTDEHSVEGVLASTERIADVIGSGDQGKILVSSLRARLDDVRRRLAGVAATRVLFVVWQQPLISVGRDAFLSDALRSAGAESIIRSRQDWPHVSMEEVVRLQPDYLVFAAADTTEDTLSMEATLAGLRDAPGWRDLKAMQEHHIAIVSDAINHPSPRLVDAIEELARKLHPDAFVEDPHVSAGVAHPTVEAMCAAEIEQ